VQSFNVLGKIAGAKRPDETVMYGAHWDAYGIGTPDAQGRTIRPGAADDAIGVAGLVEIARAFAAGPKPDRTIVFAAWTAEERGLLGSETYAVHPLYPLEKTVANLTMDILQTAGPAHDVVLVGAGQSSLEDDLARAAKTQDRTVTPETLPERGLFYRADHFSFARRGVPTLLLMGIAGPHDLVAGGKAAGEKWLEDYMACYHQTCDTWSSTLDFRGAAQDATLLLDIGKTLAFSDQWPTWRQSSEFRAIREKTAAKRR
jgi:Zn-dependent M28 family amino/carboxypeptidase